VEHEEVVLVRYGIPGVKKATFKYALGADFINVLKVLHAVGLDSTKPVTVKGMQVAPRDLVMAVTPDPARVGERMKGRAIVGTWVIGRKDGAPREVYLYQKTVGEESWADFGLQAVGWQTGFNPILGLELLARGEWGGTGVYGARTARSRPTWPRWTAGHPGRSGEPGNVHC
jgi:saccharopine dehydrogenase-like NADP-dependent oxidoreductase